MLRDFIHACLLVVIIGLVFALSPAIANSTSKSASTSNSASASKWGLLEAGDLQKISRADAESISKGDKSGYFGVNGSVSAPKTASPATTQK